MSNGTLRETHATTELRIERLALFVLDSARCNDWKLRSEDGDALDRKQIDLWSTELSKDRRKYNNTDLRNEIADTTAKWEKRAWHNFELQPQLRTELWTIRLIQLHHSAAQLGDPRQFVNARISSDDNLRRTLVNKGEDLASGVRSLTATVKDRTSLEGEPEPTLEELRRLYSISAQGVVFVDDVAKAEAREKKRARTGGAVALRSLGLLSPALSARKAAIYNLLD